MTKRLISSYANASKNDALDVTTMHKEEFASLLHSCSTLAEPQHQACPQGKESWCHFNRDKADKLSARRSHCPAFSSEIAKELMPLYNQLLDKALLVRCCRMKPQNANESFNVLVWKRCPKTEFVSLRTVGTAVAMAVHKNNLVPRGF